MRKVSHQQQTRNSTDKYKPITTLFDMHSQC